MLSALGALSLRPRNASYITNVYDMNARLLSTTLNNSSGTALDAATYGYNVANQRTNFVNAAGTNVAYSYDPLGQLTVATSSVSAENRGYNYDAAWNLNDRTNNGVNTTFSVDGKNQLTSAGTTNFHYDANGNLTNRSTSPSGSAVTNYYDNENRLVAVTTVSNFGLTHIPIQTTFVYDGLSRLRQQLWWTNSTGSGGGGGGSPPPSGGGSNTWFIVGGIEYIYDGSRVIQERDYNNNPLVSYTRGNDLSGFTQGPGGVGGLLARSDGYSAGSFADHNYYHADGNGNITYLANSSQTLAASYRYDPYGNLISSSGGLAVSNTYRFSSKEYITSVALYCYLYRFYDSGLQRWLNRDPVAEFGGLNLHAFVGNCPVIMIDPFGLDETIGTNIFISRTSTSGYVPQQPPASPPPSNPPPTTSPTNPNPPTPTPPSPPSCPTLTVTVTATNTYPPVVTYPPISPWPNFVPTWADPTSPTSIFNSNGPVSITFPDPAPPITNYPGPSGTTGILGLRFPWPGR